MDFLIFIFFLFLAPIILILLLTIPQFLLTIFERPRLNKKWIKLDENLSSFKILEDNLYVYNVRNAIYEKDEYSAKVNWENKKYNLSKLSGLTLYINPYGFLQSHTIVCFQFGSDTNFCISYEVRKVAAYKFQIYKVLYTNFEGFYCVGTESDIVGVRKNIRKTPLYKFPLDIEYSKNRELLQMFIEEINEYSTKPFFYRFLYRNCVSSVFNKLNTAKIMKVFWRVEYLNVLKLVYKNQGKLLGEKEFSYKNFLINYKF